MKIEHLPVFEIAYEMVVDVDRTAACRTSGIEQVARLEREVLADVGDDFIYLVEHIARAAFLYGLVIEVEAEVQCLDITELLDVDPFADNRRTVESLGEFPRLASLAQFLLHLACRKVDTYGYCIVITVGETLRNGLSQLGYSDHYFGFILYSSQMIRDEERLAVIEQSRICLGKDDRTLWFR